jgi:uncharacterized membrane protein
MQVQTTEERMLELERRMERVEKWTGVVRPPRPERPERVAPPVPAGATAGVERVVAVERAAHPGTSLEDLVGGRVLAWAGGGAVLLGIVLLFAIAVSRGWIGEGARTLMGAMGAFALGALGLWLQERRARTDAALAAVAASIAGLFVTVVVATQLYALLPAVAGAVAALAVGSAAVVLAVRWRAQGIAALGIVGGLLAPVLAGAPWTGGTMVLLWIAAAAATGVLVWQRWPWLAAAAFALTTAQWAAFLLHDPGATATIVVLVAFGALNAVAALRARSGLLLALNALVLAVAGALALGGDGATAWVGALAAAHVFAGVATLRDRRLPHEIALLACTLGVVLTDAALALALDGAPLALAYAGGAVALAGLARGLRAQGLDERVIAAGLGAHICLALLEALTGPGGPGALLHAGVAPAAGLASVLGLAAASIAAGRLAGPERRAWQVALDATGLAAVAYLAALSLHGAPLVIALAAEAIALAGIARRTGDEVATVAAPAFLGLALGHLLVFEAPPAALVDGLAHVGPAAAGLGAVAAAALALGRARLALPHAREAAPALAAVTLLYLASTVLITVAAPSEGQLLLSALWALSGTLALVAGLLADSRPLRLGALALLLVALAKVGVYDLSALPGVYRVGSCIVLGALLLIAAFVWQRQRPPVMRNPSARSAGQTTPAAKRVP